MPVAHDGHGDSGPSGDKLRLALLLLGPALILAGLGGIDRLIAETTGQQLAGTAALSGVVDILDLVTGKEITNFLLGSVLIALAASMNLWRGRKLVSGTLLYVGLVQFLSTTIADLSKPLAGRARPFQALVDGGWVDQWLAGPDYGSFPSGHVAFYVGLCVPIVLRRPRLAWPLLLVPLVVAYQRMSSHDHYLSDVGASILLGVTMSLIVGKWGAPPPEGSGRRGRDRQFTGDEMDEDSGVEIADRLSRRRALAMPMLAAVFLAGQAIYAVGRVETGTGVDRVKVFAWVAWAMILLTLLATGGGLFRPRAVRRLMEDESTRANRSRAYAVGFWLAMAVAIVIYGLTAFDTIAPRESLHVIVTAAIAGALVTFGYLERRDHRSG